MTPKTRSNVLDTIALLWKLITDLATPNPTKTTLFRTLHHVTLIPNFGEVVGLVGGECHWRCDCRRVGA